jgi:thymidylate synthase
MRTSLVVARGRTLPEAWERSLAELAKVGERVFTEYGEWSVDAPAVIVVEEPFAEPRVHLKGIVAGSLRGLEEYAREVVAGIHDDMARKYGYTYHERLRHYPTPSFSPLTGQVVGLEELDQIGAMVDKLLSAPHTRRAQAITWVPWKDLKSEHPPCLQRVWARVVGGRLRLHAHMRSNDALKAAFMNMYAFTELQRILAEAVGVEPGPYVHFADSYHVYERDLKWLRRFVEQIESGESRRYWRTTEEYRRMAGL